MNVPHLVGAAWYLDFNSIKVQFEHKFICYVFFLVCDFNSIKVQFEQPSIISISRWIIFQFHKGTIWTYYEYEGYSENGDFNSIKVQFERMKTMLEEELIKTFQFHKGTIWTWWFCCLLPSICLFQFHKGTIWTARPSSSVLPLMTFQFHKGTIWTEFCSEQEITRLHFNSIKVQFEHSSLPCPSIR